ncbi:hypothetical protein [Paracoccus seriniphilus]|uniref:Uncharacterized protein n=1 Tax=Paracoccus seriniphilus TaxID=184748 RepID=A0A239Q4A9_9RHOB|nr:hypothetical protein [Paracoccus seriniphilus]WCR12746.1 hypothetical protein JHW44_07125 [Paracoccus seriniphilus]SNT76787.1 hypothetical protein SAMN05444959_12815 [Paracoccus seriniphilus]
MTPPRSDQGFVRMPDAEFEANWARVAFAIPVDVSEIFAMGNLSCHRALQCLTDSRGGQTMAAKIWLIRIRLAPPDRSMIVMQANHGFATDLERYFAGGQGVEERGTPDGIGKAFRDTVPVNQEIGQSCAGRRPSDGDIVVDEQTYQTVHRVLDLLLRFIVASVDDLSTNFASPTCRNTRIVALS